MEQVGISFSARMQLTCVSAILWAQNSLLRIFGFLLFRNTRSPKNILIFKVGNIGDITCAIPLCIAIRKKYPRARITLLTSPGKRGALGAKDFLSGAWYFDEIFSYTAEDIQTSRGKKDFVNAIKGKRIDYFIQIPDDWVSFRTLARNMVFAKIIGARYASGFFVRSFLSLFRKTQIDSILRENEVLSLLRLFGFGEKDVEFSFPLSPETEKKIETLLKKEKSDMVYVGVCMGGKDETKRWPRENFQKAVSGLLENKKIQIIFFGGGKDDEESAEYIQKECGKSSFALDMTRGFSIHEQIVALKKCAFLLTNDTGPMHLAAAVGTKVIALFSIRSILGAWFPYGEGHAVFFKRNLSCDYRSSACVKKSLELISVEEVVSACRLYAGIE